MNRIFTLLVAGIATVGSSTTVQAQVADALAVPGAPETSDFRMFEPTVEEWERFRSAAQITHQGGEAVYNATCAGCHMPEGQGAVGAGRYPALANNELLAGPTYPINLVVNGQRAMPPFGEMLDDRQVADVVDYIRANFGNDFIAEYGEATPEEVSEVRP